MDVRTVRSQPDWIPGQILSVWDDGFQFRVTAYELDPGSDEVVVYDLNLDESNDISCIAPLGEPGSVVVPLLPLPCVCLWLSWLFAMLSTTTLCPV